jgi:hypothetical protein
MPSEIIRTSNPDQCPPPHNARLIANAGPDQTVHSGDLVILDEDPKHPPFSGWNPPRDFPIITSIMDDPFSERVTFIAPNVTTTTVLTFQLVVYDGEFTSCNNDFVDITVMPRPSDLPPPPTETKAKFRVVVNVIKEHGGNKNPGDFGFNIVGNSPSPAIFQGSSAPGTIITLDPGIASVFIEGESRNNPNYNYIHFPNQSYKFFMNTCKNINLKAGTTVACTVTLYDQPPTTEPFPSFPSIGKPTIPTSPNSEFPNGCTPRTGLTEWGCYCGSGNSCRQGDFSCTPTDLIDVACRQHDMDYGNCGFTDRFKPFEPICFQITNQADHKLCTSVTNLKQFSTGEAYLYIQGIRNIFCVNQLFPLVSGVHFAIDIANNVMDGVKNLFKKIF